MLEGTCNKNMGKFDARGIGEDTSSRGLMRRKDSTLSACVGSRETRDDAKTRPGHYEALITSRLTGEDVG